MQVLDLQPGTQEWLEARARYNTASEASALMGAHPSVSRNDLLRAKHDGLEKEVSRYVREKIFDHGHEVEAQARPIAEELIGEELYPATVVDDDGRLSASLDGATMSYKALWECKQWNENKAPIVDGGECPECDYPQVQQQLMVTGAEKCLYMITNGTKEKTVTCWVYPDAQYQKNIRFAWEQFEADLKDYTPPNDAPQAVGTKMSDLPALNVQVEGKVLATNVDQFREHALAVFDEINTDLQTDQDFADAKETVKWCKSVEEKLAAAKEQVIGQMASVDEVCRALDEVRETARKTRLSLDKTVKVRESDIRTEIADAARAKFAEHMSTLSERVQPVGMPAIPTDFAGAMKGKRTIKSLRDAVDQVLADAKLEANAIADRIDANLRYYRENAEDYDTLFPDLSALAQKEAEDFQAAVKLRITEHKEAEAKRAEERRQAEEAQREREAAKSDALECAQETTAARRADQEASEKAGAAMQQQADAAKAVEKSGTGQKTERWRVSVAFEFDAPTGSNGDDLAATLKARLREAGFQSVADAVAEKQKVAA